MRVREIIAVALIVAGLGACGATPAQLPDGGAAGSNTGGSSGSAGASGGSTSSDPGACIVVLASDYDQSCVVDTDCVAVNEVRRCPITDCSGCLRKGVNKGAMAQYTAALSQDVSLEPPGVVCHCPCEGPTVCREGKCLAASCIPPPADTRAACANAPSL